MKLLPLSKVLPTLPTLPPMILPPPTLLPMLPMLPVAPLLAELLPPASITWALATLCLRAVCRSTPPWSWRLSLSSSKLTTNTSGLTGVWGISMTSCWEAPGRLLSTYTMVFCLGTGPRTGRTWLLALSVRTKTWFTCTLGLGRFVAGMVRATWAGTAYRNMSVETSGVTHCPSAWRTCPPEQPSSKVIPWRRLSPPLVEPPLEKPLPLMLPPLEKPTFPPEMKPESPPEEMKPESPPEEMKPESPPEKSPPEEMKLSSPNWGRAVAEATRARV